MRRSRHTGNRGGAWPGRASLLFILFLESACTMIGGRGPSSPGPDPMPLPDSKVEEAAEVEGGVEEKARPLLDPSLGKVYQGFLMIDGGEVPAALQLVRDGRRGLLGALQATSGIEAEGTGRLRGEAMELELSYGGACPGRLVLEGRWDRETENLSGTVRATDCTGSAEGTFRFSGS